MDLRFELLITANSILPSKNSKFSMQVVIIKSGQTYLSPNGKLKIKVFRRHYTNSISCVCHCSVLENGFWHSREIFSNQDAVDTGHGLVFFDGAYPAKACVVTENEHAIIPNKNS